MWMQKDEIEYIRQNAGKLTDSQMAEWIGCSEYAVCKRRRAMGLSPKRIIWDEGKVRRFIAMYNNNSPIKDICDELSITKDNYRLRMNIFKRKGLIK